MSAAINEREREREREEGEARRGQLDDEARTAEGDAALLLLLLSLAARRIVPAGGNDVLRSCVVERSGGEAANRAV